MDTVRNLLRSTFDNYQLALSIAREAGLVDPERVEDDLPIYSYDVLVDVMKQYFKVDFTVRSRKRNYVDARHIAGYILKKYTNLALVQIAALCGNVDHTTIIHGIRKVEGLLNYGEPTIKRDIEAISAIIDTKFRDIGRPTREIEMKCATQGTVNGEAEVGNINLKRA